MNREYSWGHISGPELRTENISLKRIMIILNALTQLLGACLCITLNANESTSGACYRRRKENKWFRYAYNTINAIFFWQDNHCLRSAVHERKDSQALLDAYKNK